MRKISEIVLMLLCAFFVSMLSVNADSVVDFSKSGSISIILNDVDNEAVSGVELTVYHIADAIEKDYNLSFEYVDAMSSCDVSISDIDDNSLVPEIYKCINKNVEKYTLTSSDDGKILFSNLKLGLYLVSQSNEVDEYSNIESFLVKIPFEEENTWKYDIEASPKVDIYKTIDLIVKKEWNSNRDKLPTSVTIALYSGNKNIDTVVLDESNNWTYTFEKIEKRDDYSIKEVDIPKGYVATYKNKDYVFTVINTDSLAPTGQRYELIFIMAFIGLFCILLGTIKMKGNLDE